MRTRGWRTEFATESLQSIVLFGLLRRDEIGEDGLAHEVGREQALREDEIVEFLLVEFLAEGAFRFLAKLQETREAVEV
jgi:hypothetical protein